MRIRLFPPIQLVKQAKLEFRLQSCARAYNTTHMGTWGSNKGFPMH